MCPICGAQIPEETGGMCPVCLLGIGLGGTTALFRQYRPVGVLGEGGMGIVYLAEQTEPVRRRIALKLMKHAAGGQSLARFESERQALALMEHPGIAKLYDAGATAEGLPYFVMEYVPGLAITDYCDRNATRCRERLRLFRQVCDAVQHAHQKGIIHRDLKPSNILVALRDGVAIPKIIDFGVAKATDARLTEQTLFTEAGVLIGTPEYMSPEQAQGNTLDVDSTSDIYSLGVLLYELLVGATPFDSTTLRRAGYDEIRRVICEQEPPHPTARLSGLGPVASEVAKRRGGDVASLMRTVRGDLDWITMKAIEKDRGRRYPSASEFSADIGRYLLDEPVTARPPGTAYKIRKFIRRRRLEVSAAAAVLVAIVAGLIVSTTLMFQMQRERDQARWTEYKATLAAARSDIEEFRSREAIRALEATPAGFRGWEWKYLYALADTSRWSFTTGTMSDAARLCYSGESRLIVAHGRTVQVWNLESGTREAGYGPFQQILDMTRDGSRIIMANAEVLEVATGKRVAALAEPAAAGAFSRDGLRVATATQGGVIRVWRVADGSLLRTISSAPQEAGVPRDSLLLNADGSRVTHAAEASVRIWNVATGRLEASLEHGLFGVQSVTISAKDHIFSATDNVREWDTSTGKLLRTWTPKVATAVRATAVSEDGALIASAGWHGELQLWRPDSEQAVGSLFGAPVNQPAALAFSPGARYLAAISQGGRVKVWDASTAGNRILRTSEDPILSFRISPDGARMAVAKEDGLELIDARDGQKIAFALSPVTALAMHPATGAIASSAPDRIVRLWTGDLQPSGVKAGPFFRTHPLSRFRPEPRADRRWNRNGSCGTVGSRAGRNDRIDTGRTPREPPGIHGRRKPHGSGGRGPYPTARNRLCPAHSGRRGGAAAVRLAASPGPCPNLRLAFDPAGRCGHPDRVFELWPKRVLRPGSTHGGRVFGRGHGDGNCFHARRVACTGGPFRRHAGGLGSKRLAPGGEALRARGAQHVLFARRPAALCAFLWRCAMLLDRDVSFARRSVLYHTKVMATHDTFPLFSLFHGRETDDATGSNSDLDLSTGLGCPAAGSTTRMDGSGRTGYRPVHSVHRAAGRRQGAGGWRPGVHLLEPVCRRQYPGAV